MALEDLKKEAYKLHAQVCQVLSHPKRLEILDLLSEGEKSLEELAQAMGVSKANVSQHLALMRQRNLVSARREGLRTYYRIANPKLLRAWEVMREVALEQLEAIEDLMQAIRQANFTAKPVEELTLAELIRRLEREDVVLLDVRSAEEYKRGHIPKALSLPLEEIDRRWKDLPRDKELVAYCRGPYCVLSDRAAQKLREYGIQVKKLSVGYPEWEQAGFPVEK
jgi:rhodanese-related sulfurtransferase/biotin operon repressor